MQVHGGSRHFAGKDRAPLAFGLLAGRLAGKHNSVRVAGDMQLDRR
jgi:hypothetical protein